ncbi:hypothetical protein COCC4DRAFT_138037 [Bipolaris maydis ATCC 48331]|uniref:Secreted protein n=1 Tax=Cochliobolus heterostrophus (strain C4 / ATCC 48331 / race T) TaxID=665024 RepID=N4X9W2_COCH4|nr:uncharacterized protein COCC4DRAFT_138037 [Bipolaris maydis ATCC 48331]ENI05303.1 hypothetical protein COCC4DRAFT_138037 [Bipolaris maydis ATCC 48331]
MHVRIVVTITSLLSLTVAQGNWNCKNLDDPTFRNDAYARAHNPYGLCVNDAGVGLLAHPCRSVRSSFLLHILILIALI